MLDPKEENRIKKRDKRFQEKNQMVVSEAGRKLAEILLNLRRKKQKK